jgi:hypothetical protein
MSATQAEAPARFGVGPPNSLLLTLSIDWPK